MLTARSRAPPQLCVAVQSYGPSRLRATRWGDLIAMTDFKFDPRRTALLNIDMQNCFVENSPVAAPRGREILPRINKLA
jgi:hypothetical protein